MTSKGRKYSTFDNSKRENSEDRPSENHSEGAIHYLWMNVPCLAPIFYDAKHHRT